MTLRTFFALMGLLMLVSQVWFLILFRPPGGLLPHSRPTEFVLRPLRRFVNDLRHHWNEFRGDVVIKHLWLSGLPVFSTWRPYPPSDSWWIGGALRLLSTSVLMSGIRLFFVNVVNSEKPVVFTSLWDQTIAVVTIGLGGLAPVVFLAVYLRYRKWDA